MRTQFYILYESILIGHKCTLFALHKNLSYKMFFEIECRNFKRKSHFAKCHIRFEYGTFIFTKKEKTL